MNKQHIILYSKDVQYSNYISTLLSNDKEIIIHIVQDIKEIQKYTSYYHIHCILYECDLLTSKNQTDIKDIESIDLPYLIITNQVIDDIGVDHHKIILKSKERSLLPVFASQLIVKIKSLYLQVEKRKKQAGSTSVNVIAIGASTGGPHAILKILKELPTNISGIVIVQHMIENNIESFADYLNGSCSLIVKVAKENEIIKNGVVYLAKPKWHLIVKRKRDGYHLRYIDGKKVNCVCPSIDVLFQSIATQVGTLAIGILLTGMGSDGAIGLKKMKDTGALTIIQDKKTSDLYGMPKEAKKINAHQIELPLELMSKYLINYFNLKEKRKIS